MKNFIFKSDKSDLQKMFINKLETILAEQRHARVDLAYIIRVLNRSTTNKNLQQQVDEYFDDDDDISSNQSENK